ncbi:MULTISPECIES: CARDB domain-containing protein [unclassified Haladaptatus]|uniref:CARDB domain-containing protein n=1 Tax=unclassified Haladaptatus TaxID=2622732 RepID=UPI00209C0CD5|nr:MULTISPECIES: CARDB domain-containing protein [unclassified Haladaptatus]MCO8243295.1 hypothetical protein [Haladaptatus sp. AB643]MCO8253006.1 hypothetical protein [Haladaptatus sp. AB618]
MSRNHGRIRAALLVVIALMVVVRITPPSVSGANNIGIGINGEDETMIAPGDSYVLRADSPGLSTYAVGLRNEDLLSVSGASLSGPSGTVGDSVTVSATITNRGNWMADETVAVTANGTNVATRTITVPVGETKTISFGITLDHPGTYDVAVDGTSAGTLVLSGATETTETSGDVTTTESSTASTSSRTTETVGTTHTTTLRDSSKTNRDRRPKSWSFVAVGALVLAALLVIRRR